MSEKIYLVVRHDRHTDDIYTAFWSWSDALHHCRKITEEYPDNYQFKESYQYGEFCLYCSDDYFVTIHSIPYMRGDITGMARRRQRNKTMTVTTNPLTKRQWGLVLDLCYGLYIRVPSIDNLAVKYAAYLATSKSTNEEIPAEDFKALFDKKLLTCIREDRWWSLYKLVE